jgi:inhibitor of KinA sporulation pathway (predicted exonuclease)
MGQRPKLDKILVLDLEVTTWDNQPPPPNEHPEIIQIGICSLVVATKEIVDKASFIIKPRHSTISPYFEELTGLTKERVKGGLMFEHVCNKIAKDYGSRNRVWAAYGNDREAFERECEIKQALYPFSRQYIDISTLFHLKCKHSGGVGLELALKMVGAEFVGTPHRAEEDAYNAAELLKRVLW